jgi:hypothetical protein
MAFSSKKLINVATVVAVDVYFKEWVNRKFSGCNDH